MLETFQHSAHLEVGDHDSPAFQRLSPCIREAMMWIALAMVACLTTEPKTARASEHGPEVLTWAKINLSLWDLSQEFCHRKGNLTHKHTQISVWFITSFNVLIKFLYFRVFSHTHAHWNRYHSICVEINLLGSVFAFHHAKLGCEGSAAGAFFPPRHHCSLHSFEVFIINFLFLREGTHMCRFSLMFVQVTRGYHPPHPTPPKLTT